MKSVLKTRILPILVCMVLVFAATPLFASAEGNAAVSVSNASGKAGDEVTVNVNLTENPGVIAMNLNVNYDPNQLELVSSSNAGVLNGYCSAAPSGNSGSYTLNWEDALASSNNNGTGTVATLTFRLKEDCDTASVNVSGVGHNYDVEAVSVSGGKGTITNTNPTTTTTTTTTTKPTTTKPTTTKPTTTKPMTTKSSSTRAYTTASYTRSNNPDNTYPFDFDPTTEEESTTDLLNLWESTTEWTMTETTEESTTEAITELEQNNGTTLSKTKIILIALMACFALIGIAVIISMVRKSKQ